MIDLRGSLERLPVNTKSLLLAYSGGIDSTVLLHALLAYQQRYRLVIWHINHGLQDNASSMEDFARQQALRFNLEFRLERLHMDSSEANLEAKARDRRYQLFEQGLSSQDVLLTGHHKTDQAETLVLNLLRGSGSAGLRAIARKRPLGKGLLFRPLLDFTRDDVERYAKHYQLDWVEDPSNTSLRYDRNYLRHEVFPALTQRWPAVIEQFQRVSELQNESEQLHLDLAEIDYANARLERPYSKNSCLSADVLNVLSAARKKNLIRFWLKQNNFSVIGFHRMEELLRQLESRVDATPVIDGKGFTIRLYKKALYLLKHSRPFNLESSYPLTPADRLRVKAIGLCCSRAEVFDYLQRKDEGQPLSFHFRQEAPGTGTNQHAHTLKRLFQRHQIPPWIRYSIPQIYLDQQLVKLWLL